MRRPIEAHEVVYLHACGARLAELRRDAGLSQRKLATAAELAPSTVERVEAGTRRTRRSTLDRIAGALNRPEAAAELADLAGPALAPESPYAERIARRRERRKRSAECARQRKVGSELLALAWLYAHGSRAELADYLHRRGAL